MRSAPLCLALPILVAACGDEEPSLSPHIDIDPACGELIDGVVVADIGCGVEVLLSVNGISDRAEWELHVVLPGQPEAFFQVPADEGLALSWTPEPVQGAWRATAGRMRFELVDLARSDDSGPAAVESFDTLVIDPAAAPAAYVRAVSWSLVADEHGTIGHVDCGDTLGIKVALGGDLAAIGSVGADVLDVDFLGTDHLADVALGRDQAASHRWMGTWSPPCGGGDPGGWGGNDLVFRGMVFDRDGAPLDEMSSAEIDGPAL